MRLIAIFNQKGGSGKTTTAVNLAAALGEQDRHVLVLDLDPQASASSWLGVKDGGRGLLDVFTDGLALAGLIQPTSADGVDVIPSSTWLVGAEKALAGEVGAETILRRRLAALKGPWQYILIDCPPALGLLTVNALAAAQEVLVTVETHVMALSGLARLLETLEVVKERLNPDVKIAGILACRVNARTRHAQEVVEQLQKRFGSLLYHTLIRENVRLAECPSFGQPITLYDPRCNGATDYRQLATEVIRQENRRAA
ncbi:MAG TPA: ParA family protein [Nitrospiraceae bacterium]|nr:ParA family protein [Nitrospiraceae bacterium]